MTSYVPPVKNGAGGWIGYISLAPRTSTGQWQTNPTLASGDVKLSKDGGALANLTTLPVVTPAGSDLVKITLSQTECDADNLTIELKDAAGAEWCDLTINLQTVARQIDDLASTTAVDALPTNAELATALAAADDAVLTAIANLNSLSQADVRAAIGLAAANLDTQLAALGTLIGDVPTNAELSAALATADDAVLAAVAALIIPSVAQILTIQMTESYAADGVAPSLAQAIFAIHQHLMAFDILGVNRTVRKLNGSDIAFTETLNSPHCSDSSVKMSASTITTEGFGPNSTIHLVVLMGYGDAGVGTITSAYTTKDIEVTVHREDPHRWNFKVGRPR